MFLQDLSPLSTLNNRSGQPSTPPPSPDRGNRTYARDGTEEQGHDSNQECFAMFSQQSETASSTAAVASCGGPSMMTSSSSTATGPSTVPPVSRSTVYGFTGTGCREKVEMDARGGGIAGMESCVPGGSSGGQQASTTGSTTPPMNSETPSGSITGEADDLGLDMEIFDFDRSVAGLEGDIGGGPHEDELTIAALDPMEVDALLSTPDPVNAGSSLSISEAVVIAEERRGDLEEGSSTRHVATAADAARSGSADSVWDTGAGLSATGAATLLWEEQGGQQQIGGTGGRTTVESSAMSSGRGEGVVPGVTTRGSRFASTLAAGVVGAMCLAGVVMNSGTPSVSICVEFCFVFVFEHGFWED